MKQVKLEYHNDMSNSHKFYEINHLPGYPKIVVVRWGPVGKRGQTKDHAFDTEEEAGQFVINQKNRKVTKGYVEV